LNYRSGVSAPLLFLLYHTSQFEYSLICEKVPVFFTSFLWDSIPRPGKRATLDPSSKKKVCCLNSPFVRFWNLIMDQRPSRVRQAFDFIALDCGLLSMIFRFQRRKEEFKQTAYTQPQNYRLLRLLLHIARSRRLPSDLLR
jgi:hypothetical protein